MTAAFAIILGMIVLIPVLAILIDSPLSEALARRIASKDSEPANARLDAIEKEMQYLTQAVESLEDEAEFVRSLVEGRGGDHALPPPEEDEPADLEAGANGEI
jgi:hypothetical protein